MGSAFSREPATPTTITYTVDGGPSKTEDFDFVVVACDPRGINISDRTDFEKKVINSLHSHTFHTSLFPATRPNREQQPPAGKPGNGPPQTNYAVRFDPDTLEAMDGGLYGFRDEVMARDPGFQPSKTGETWAVTYQIENTPLIGRNASDVERKLNIKRDAALKSNVWVDWTAADPVATKEITVDYFAHFKQESLREGMPWQLIEEQGKHKTLYIASFACFESVLHCFLYQNMLMKRRDVQAAFPRNRNARIAVIGAGPAGLLFASQHLANKGYSNFTIFESTARFGGKTQTEYQPIPDGAGDVPCELGTCYLSPAYFPMYDLFEKYAAGEVFSLDRNSNLFRSIIDPALAQSAQEEADGIEFGAWSGHRKIGAASSADGQARIVRATVLYILYHVCAFGTDPEDPLPERKPSVANVVGNVASIIAWMVANLDDVSDLVETFSLRSLFKGILNGGGVLEKADEETKKEVIEFEKEVEKQPDLDIDLHDIMRLFSVDLFKKTYGELLDDLDIGDLKPTLIYAYQVQGYGTLTRIPAYYGMVWITPYVFLNQMLAVAFPPAPDSDRAKRGTVNVLNKGWYNVWTKIVEKDLPADRFIYKAQISGIDRHLST